MSSGRYNQVNISTYYFTKDGTIAGKPCRLNVVGLDALQFTKTGRNDFDADGNAYVFLVANPSQLIRIEIEYILDTTLQSLIGFIQNAMDTETTIPVGIDGDLGTFSLNTVPKFPRPITLSGKFDNGRVDGVTIELYTT